MKSYLFSIRETLNYCVEKLKYIIKKKYLLQNTENTGSRILIHNDYEKSRVCIKIPRCRKLRFYLFYTILNLCTHCTHFNYNYPYFKKNFFILKVSE